MPRSTSARAASGAGQQHSVIVQGRTTRARSIETKAKCSYWNRRMSFSGQGLVPMIIPARTRSAMPQSCCGHGGVPSQNFGGFGQVFQAVGGDHDIVLEADAAPGRIVQARLDGTNVPDFSLAALPGMSMGSGSW